jgi:hypothetical protein
MSVLHHGPSNSSTEGILASDEKFSLLSVVTGQTRDGREIVEKKKEIKI